jgi:hypothetical protein
MLPELPLKFCTSHALRFLDLNNGPNFSFSYHTTPLAPSTPAPVIPAVPVHHVAPPVQYIPQPAAQLQPHQLYHQPAPVLPDPVPANAMAINEHPPEPYQGAMPVYEEDHQNAHINLPVQPSPIEDVTI